MPVKNAGASHGHLTIIPRARMGSESVAHEAEGRQRVGFYHLVRQPGGIVETASSQVSLLFENLRKL